MDRLIKEVIQNCKNGEYDDADIMRLYCYAEATTETIERSLKVIKELTSIPTYRTTGERIVLAKASRDLIADWETFI